MNNQEHNKNDDDDDHHHTINVSDVNNDHIASMHRKISATPKLLTKSAGKPSCCIFKVPQTFVDINGKSYQPHIVSIGPYHHGEPRLRMIEEHKWVYLGSLLKRTTKHKGLGLEDYLKAIEPLEEKARECYSETLNLESHEFVEMLVLDGCFLIELFRKVAKLVPFEKDDPIISMAWILTFFYRDFLRLENQIPYFVLECLFDLTMIEHRVDPRLQKQQSLSTLALEFFNNAMQRPDEDIAKFRQLKGKHLLDVVRNSFIPFDENVAQKCQNPNPNPNPTPTHIIYCVSKLRHAGITLKQGHHHTFLLVKFKHGVIEMPTITIDDFMSSFLQNCVAYEQCQNGCSKHFTTYATLLDCLINGSKDVEYLGDHNIIENYFGTDAEVAKFINDLGKEMSFDIDVCYLSSLFNDVYEYYKKSWHVQWASFKYTYFDTPWSFISAFAALILLLLTVTQTIFTVYPNVK